MFAPAGQEEAQVQTAQELAAGDSYDYGGDGSDSNPYLGRASSEAMNLLSTSPNLNQASFNALKGITATNPYPDSFFSQLFGPENVNYAALGVDVQGIANLAYDRYRNPFGDTTGITKVEDLKLREGLSEGEKTRFGEVISIDRPQNIGETIARTAFGFTPLGPIASFMGKDQLALAPNDKTNFQGSPNYDPTLDPNSSEYQGPQGMLGQMAKGIEQITFGGARPVTETSKGIMSLFEGQDAERAMGGYETFDGQKM